MKKADVHPKRRFRSARKIRMPSNAVNEGAWLRELSKAVSYVGNPMHKRNPGDFGLMPPSAARQGKTLCDDVDIFSKAVATRLLRRGVVCGLISEQMIEQWPQNIWAVADNGRPLEAMYDGINGTYHGYPMDESDPLSKEVKRRWLACRLDS